MPMYEYKCNECSAKFEQFQKSLASSQRIECPQCKSEKVTKLFSSFAAVGSSGGSFESDYSDSCSAPAGGCCGGGSCSVN
ncbi:MAG: hypothetical protein AMXMBFR48_29620 [Ignavibacteriales bacterium]